MRIVGANLHNNKLFIPRCTSYKFVSLYYQINTSSVWFWLLKFYLKVCQYFNQFIGIRVTTESCLSDTTQEEALKAIIEVQFITALELLQHFRNLDQALAIFAIFNHRLILILN